MPKEPKPVEISEKKKKKHKKDKKEKKEKKDKKEKKEKKSAVDPEITEAKPMARVKEIPEIQIGVQKLGWDVLDTLGVRGSTNLATKRVLGVIKKQEQFGRDRRAIDEFYDPDSNVPPPTKSDLFSVEGLLSVPHSKQLVSDRRITYSRTCPSEYWKQYDGMVSYCEWETLF